MDPLTRIQVLVVEDNPLTRAGLQVFINANPQLRLVGLVPTGERAIEICGHSEPDVIVMDMSLPGMDGVATTIAIKQQYPRVRVVALSSSDDQNLMARAYEAGVTVYVLKTSPPFLLLNAILSAYRARETQA